MLSGVERGPERVVVQAEAVEAARVGGDGSGEGQLADGAALDRRGGDGLGQEQAAGVGHRCGARADGRRQV